MMQFRLSLFVAAAVTFFSVASVQGQVFTPTYMAPRASSDIGVYFSDGPGQFALEGIWRRGQGGFDLGLRAGVADTEDVSVLLGGELRNPLTVGTPLDLAVTGGLQGVLGDVEAFGALIGLSVGHTFGMDALTITPYVHPRVGIIDGFGAGEADLEVLADFGLDFRLNQQVELRFGVGLDDESADWGIGFAWR